MPNSASNLWVIELRSPSIPHPLLLRLEDQVVIGRSDQNHQIRPDVDLGPFGAEQQGVSRQHLAVRCESDQLVVTDLQSGNGTVLNGVRLEPDKPYPLGNEDHLQLGAFKLDVRVIVSPVYGSVFHKQPSLQLYDQLQPGNGQLVLIVEDRSPIAQALTTALTQAGYITVVSRDVIGAIRTFNQRRPSAAILDLLLSDLHALEFCRYVRRDGLNNTMPLVVISSAKSQDDVARAMQAGADIFMGTPVSVKELRHVVASLIAQYESGVASLHTRELVGTAPLQAVPPASRRDSVVLYVAGHDDKPITLTVSQSVSFGRTVNLPGRNHIDLSLYDAMELGVSRMHMVLHNKGGRFYIEDADSPNGTYLNGDPLRPHELVPVRNGDEIRLGKLRMYIYFLTDPEHVANHNRE